MSLCLRGCDNMYCRKKGRQKTRYITNANCFPPSRSVHNRLPIIYLQGNVDRMDLIYISCRWTNRIAICKGSAYKYVKFLNDFSLEETMTNSQLWRRRTLLALANPFYWFTVNIAICQRHLGKGRRRVEQRCRKNWALRIAATRDRMKFQDCFSFSFDR